MNCRVSTHAVGSLNQGVTQCYQAFLVFFLNWYIACIGIPNPACIGLPQPSLHPSVQFQYHKLHIACIPLHYCSPTPCHKWWHCHAPHSTLCHTFLVPQSAQEASVPGLHGAYIYKYMKLCTAVPTPLQASEMYPVLLNPPLPHLNAQWQGMVPFSIHCITPEHSASS